MIYQFNGKCQESQQFQLNVDVGSVHTFFELHLALQSALHFQPVQLASFLVPLSKGRRHIEITMIGPGNGRSGVYSMQDTLIGEIMIPGRKSIFYLFDSLNDRFINLQLTGTNMEKNLREPLVTLNRGEIPIQTIDEVISGDLMVAEVKSADPNYGVLNDYYGIFGEMEEFVL